MSENPEPSSQLRDSLSEIFCEEVEYDMLDRQKVGEASVLVIRMDYTRRDSSGHPSRVSQTAVVLDDADVEVPQFTLAPKMKGLAGMLLGRLSGMATIKFDETPQFAEHYQLHGWNESATRALFTSPVLQFLLDNHGWSVRGAGRLIVVFKQDQLCDPTEMDSFVSSALQLLSRFQESEEAMDDQPNLRRDASIEDVMATAEKMGGIHAMMLKKELEKRRLSSSDLNRFLAQPVPRSNAPKGLRYQVGGDNASVMLIALGACFFIAGILIPILIVSLAEKSERLIAIPFGIMFPLIGGLILVFSIRYRRQRKRLLRSGILVTGVVKKVQRTNVQVNNAQRYHLHVDFDLDGTPSSAVANLYANIEKAKKLASTGESVRILVDPADHQKVLCVDALLLFE